MADVGFWTKLGEYLCNALHWVTGLIVHPDKGGCCANEKNNLKNEK